MGLRYEEDRVSKEKRRGKGKRKGSGTGELGLLAGGNVVCLWKCLCTNAIYSMLPSQHDPLCTSPETPSGNAELEIKSTQSAFPVQ